MANLKEIRVRIASVVSTRQITSAMKMVSAAKLKKAQDAVTRFRPYAFKMQEIMQHVASSTGGDADNVYAEDRDHRQQVLIVVITSNRGLCGAFNSNVIKGSLRLAGNKYGDLMKQGKVRFVTVGKKGYDALRKQHIPVDENIVDIFDRLTYDSVAPIAQSLMDAFTAGRYDCIDIVYNEFINAATQKLICRPFLPLLPEASGTGQKKVKHTDYLFEPTKEYIIRELIPQNLKLVLYEILLDSFAAEHGARMTSMHQATDNASSLIRDLTLQYNKARQAAITGEIVEIVGGAEALKG